MNTLKTLYGTGLYSGPSYSKWLGFSPNTRLWADDGFGELVWIRDREKAYTFLTQWH